MRCPKCGRKPSEARLPMTAWTDGKYDYSTCPYKDCKHEYKIKSK